MSYFKELERKVDEAGGELPAVFHRSPDAITVGEVVDAYLAHGAGNIAPRTLCGYKATLDSFVKHVGRNRTVRSCRMMEFQTWTNKMKDSLRSGWSRRRAAASIKRPFNWAESMGLVLFNPFRRAVWRGQCRRGRPVSDEEFQALMRNTDAAFRRFLVFMKFTGCRPGEAAGLKWSDVNLEQGIARLSEHKTAEATSEDRIVIFPPQVVALLNWMKRSPKVPLRRGNNLTLAGVAAHMVRLLENWGGPVPIAKMRREFKALGVSVSMQTKVRKALGIEKKYLGKPARWAYALPEKLRPLPVRGPEDSDHVFLCERGTGWTRNALFLRIYRLRKRADLPMSCKLHGLRHAFGTNAILNEVPLKIVSQLMGHRTTRMTEHYCTLAGREQQLRAAARQAVQKKDAPDGRAG